MDVTSLEEISFPCPPGSLRCFLTLSRAIPLGPEDLVHSERDPGQSKTQAEVVCGHWVDVVVQMPQEIQTALHGAIILTKPPQFL